MADCDDTWGNVFFPAAEQRPPSIPAPFQPSANRQCLWLPKPDLVGVPPETGVAIVCCISPECMRAFRPIGGCKKPFDDYQVFFRQTWACGFPILCAQLPDSFDLRTYRLMWFLFQKCHKTKSFIVRRFNSAIDLRVRNPSSVSGAKMDLLPWPIDRWHRERGYPQSVNELLEAGGNVASQSGISNPSTSQKIHLAIAAAAELEHPETLSVDQIRKRIEHALFEIGDRPSDLTEELEEEIKQRLLEVLWRHIDSDESQSDFNEWFWGGSNSFVKQVAQGVKDVPLDDATGMAWHVLLKLGIQSYEYIGQCIQAVMHDLARGLDPPLSAEEAADFEGLYYPHESFGGLPLILLAEKLEFFEGQTNRLLTERSSRVAQGAFHRLLLYYGELVRARREADRESKARAKHAAAAKDSLRAPRRRRSPAWDSW
jgi:hypothetical protein